MADEDKKDGELRESDEELDFDSVVADLNRQAYEKELEALANLTLLRSSFDNPEALSPEDQARRDLDARLQKIISDLTED